MLATQKTHLLARADGEAQLQEVDESLVEALAQLEPYGNGNPAPILQTRNVSVASMRRMGNEGQHVRLTVSDTHGASLELLAFSAPEHFFVEAGDVIDVWYQPEINEWQGRRDVQGRMVRLELVVKDGRR